MGCYNAPCALSGLAIQEDERVVVFPIIDGRVTMYPFRGTYDGSGSLKTIDNHAFDDILLKRVQSIIVPSNVASARLVELQVEADRNKKRSDYLCNEIGKARSIENNEAILANLRMELNDVPDHHFSIMSGKSPRTINELFELIARGDIMLYDNNIDKFRHISLLFVHESIWDKVKNIPRIDDRGQQYECSSDNKYIRYVDEMKSLLTNADENPFDPGCQAMLEMQYGIILASILHYDLKDIMTDYIRVSDWFIDRLTSELLDYMVTYMQEMHKFVRTMGFMNRDLSHVISAGQSTNKQYMRMAYKIFSEN